MRSSSRQAYTEWLLDELLTVLPQFPTPALIKIQVATDLNEIEIVTAATGYQWQIQTVKFDWTSSPCMFIPGLLLKLSVYGRPYCLFKLGIAFYIIIKPVL